MRSQPGLRAWLFPVLLLAACVPLAQGPQPGAAPPQAEPQAEPPAAGGLTCLQVLQCAGACASDEACIGDCRARGGAEAQVKVTALLDCATNRCQDDADCTTTSCRAEVDACVADAAVAAAEPAAPAEPPAGTSAGAAQPHPTANILPWMVGDWIGTIHQFTFHADGRVRRASGVPLYTDKGRYACVSLINDEGTVRQESDLLIMSFETTDTNHCGSREAVEAVVVRYRIEWYDNPYDNDPNLQLGLRDIDCTKGHDMYCLDRLRRR